MKNILMKRSLISILFLIEIISLFLTYKSFLNKEIEKTKEIYKIDKNVFSMFINDGDNNYTEYTSSNLFPDGYKINLTKSKCIDTKGNEIEGILSGNGTNITLKSTTTSYCYLYFDINRLNEILQSDDLWTSTLEDDGYRYVGTNPDNYICFGTTDNDTCISDTDLYMYRIIGIFEDESGTQHLKLIKKEALNTNYIWDSQYSINVNWDASDLYNGINGSYFLTNTTYSYMQDSIWLSKITTWNYTATNTKTSESSGIDYTNETVKNIYLHEMNLSTKTSTVGEWKTVSAKIGLMYVSDYLLSLGGTALNYTNSNYAEMKTGWMHITNNDSGAPSQYEWTMSRYGYNNVYNAWYIGPTGAIGAVYVQNDAIAVRPVFYLTNDITISGEGTTTSPYIIS